MSGNVAQLSVRAGGFTLLEVMVALAVIAIALAALVRGASESAVAEAHLRDKTFARWVALNRVAELRLHKQWPETGEKSSDEELARQHWYCRAKVVATEDPDVRKVELEVRLKDDRASPVIDRVTAFLPRPASGSANP